LNYTTFQFTQDTGQWKTGWDLAANKNTTLKIDFINNNKTHALWVSKFSAFVFDRVGTANDYAFYITNITNPGTPDPTITAYTCPNPAPNDYCLKINSSDAGNNKVTVHFGAKNEQTTELNKIGPINRYQGYILMFGKFCPQNDPKSCNGIQYGQNLPFIAIEVV